MYWNLIWKSPGFVQFWGQSDPLWSQTYHPCWCLKCTPWVVSRGYLFLVRWSLCAALPLSRSHSPCMKSSDMDIYDSLCALWQIEMTIYRYDASITFLILSNAVPEEDLFRVPVYKATVIRTLSTCQIRIVRSSNKCLHYIDFTSLLLVYLIWMRICKVDKLSTVLV